MRRRADACRRAGGAGRQHPFVRSRHQGEGSHHRGHEQDLRAERVGRHRARRAGGVRGCVWQSSSLAAAGRVRRHALRDWIDQQAIHGRHCDAARAGGKAVARRSGRAVVPGADPRQRGQAAQPDVAYVGLPGLCAAGLHHPGVDQADHPSGRGARMGDQAARFRSGHAVSVQQYQLQYRRPDRGEGQRTAVLVFSEVARARSGGTDAHDRPRYCARPARADRLLPLRARAPQACHHGSARAGTSPTAAWRCRWATCSRGTSR